MFKQQTYSFLTMFFQLVVGLRAVPDPEHTCIHGHYYTSACTHRHENRAMYKHTSIGINCMFTVHLCTWITVYIDKLTDILCKHTKDQLCYILFIDMYCNKNTFKLIHVRILVVVAYQNLNYIYVNISILCYFIPLLYYISLHLLYLTLSVLSCYEYQGFTYKTYRLLRLGKLQILSFTSNNFNIRKLFTHQCIHPALICAFMYVIGQCSTLPDRNLCAAAKVEPGSAFLQETPTFTPPLRCWTALIQMNKRAGFFHAASMHCAGKTYMPFYLKLQQLMISN